MCAITNRTVCKRCSRSSIHHPSEDRLVLLGRRSACLPQVRLPRDRRPPRFLRPRLDGGERLAERRRVDGPHDRSFPQRDAPGGVSSGPPTDALGLVTALLLLSVRIPSRAVAGGARDRGLSAPARGGRWGVVVIARARSRVTPPGAETAPGQRRWAPRPARSGRPPPAS
jgi:hypothetical protein